ncbi:MAG TPA: ABC transporter substrate-binding protein [Candidatus Limnocylindrales bacterium]|nr:ABC transporter substrate-binding protein [Candidatus Limnocylindrales bacterium]
MTTRCPLLTLVLALVLLVGVALAPVPAAAQSQMTWAVHVSLAPTWFDPAEHTGIITIMKVLYAVHDALVKPMPGNPMAPSLAESWSTSRDGLSYEFVLRKGVVFQNGDPFTAEDVKFSFERYRGAAAKLLKDKVAAVEIVDPYRVRFRLKEAWPDFMTFYGTPATGAAWIVPKKYVEKVGDEGFKRAPIGAGPYRLAAFSPGIELVFEAHDKYWRKTPAVKKMVWKVVPEDVTRLAMLKRGETDVAYSLRGPLGEEVKRTAGLKLVPTVISATQWFSFGPLQFDPKSPWHDRRVRLAAALAFDKNAINQAETLGHSKPTGSIIPSAFEYALAIPAYPYDPAQAKKLLAEAGYPNGFDAGEYMGDVSYGSVAEAIANYLGAVGIRTKVRPMERAAYLSQWKDKKFRAVHQAGAGGLGNAATRVQNYFNSDGLYAWGGYPDMDDLYVQQARELDPKRREMILHQIQKLAHERVIAAPLWELGFLNAVGPRVAESGLGLISYHPYSAPYEDLKLK